MKCYVLGTGPTLSHYQQSNITTFGVNDIFSYLPVDHLLVVDHPWSFKSNDRVKVIENSTPLQFYSQIEYWKQFFPETFNKVKLKPTRGEVDLIAPELSYSFDSTFIACILAYKKGFTEIITFGVDFLKHPRLTRHEKNILRNYAKLRDAFNDVGVKLYVGHKDSRLSKVLECKQFIYS